MVNSSRQTVRAVDVIDGLKLFSFIQPDTSDTNSSGYIFDDISVENKSQKTKDENTGHKTVTDVRSLTFG